MKKLILAFICLFLAIPSQARIITVDDDGPADFDNIQAAIDDANDDDTIIVATGTYTGSGNCDIDFLGKVITVRSTDPNDPNIVANTVIDGQGYARGFIFQSGEDANSILSGFTIVDGYSFDYGTGIYCYGSSPTITNCTISNCIWDFNISSIFCDQSSPTIKNCTITDNGGGIYCWRSSSPTITDCTITGNGTVYDAQPGISCVNNSNPTILSCKISNNSGGGIYSSYDFYPYCAPTVTGCTIKDNNGRGIANSEGPVTNCTITSNTAMVDGGGLYHCSGPITGCIISDNSTEGNGGGLYKCNGPITNCTITGNKAEGDGGGLYECNGPITNCIIKGNSAGADGGGIFGCYYDPITNCTITGNIAGGAGGGIRGYDTIKNCTITGNFAGDYCGGLYAGGEITNCIIWGNQPIQNDADDVTYSNIQGGWPGQGNIDQDPCFAFSTDYHIMPSSPCVNAGDPDYIPEPNETDLDGNLRVIGGRIDMGAFECNPDAPAIAVSATNFYFTQDWPKPEPQTLLIRNAGSGTLYWEITEDCNWLQISPANGVSTGQINEVTITVDPNGFAPGLYSYDFNIQDPNASNNPVTVNVAMPVGQVLPVPSQEFNTIQDAIDAADNYDIVLVADGNYTGEGNKDLDFREKPITVCSENGPNSCIINCENSGRGFYLHNNKGTDAILKGFTITNGYASEEDGAVYCEGIKFVSSPLITNCIITGNSAEDGGICCRDSSPIITSCTITGNSAESRGGGIYCRDSSPTITSCTITGNIAGDDGGGMCDCDGPITNCTISGNSAGWDGGGMCDCDGPITNCTISGNSAGEGGGGICCFRSRPEIINCIIWGNRPEQIDHADSVTYSNVQDGWPGLGNIDADPCFVQPGYWADVNDPNIIVEPNDPNAVWVDGDYHLKSEGWSWDIKRSRWTYDDVTSRCIDAGNPGSPLADEPITIPDDPNNIWGQNLRINMGAFGGTAEASMPPYDWAILGDLTNDGLVNLTDFASQAADWLNSADQQPGDLNRDSLIYISDLALLVEDWLKQTTWHE
jgi:parallel beta-helix repeat protein